MPDTITNSMNRMEEALKRMPKTDAEFVVEGAAIRAEAIADYIERLGRADTKN